LLCQKWELFFIKPGVKVNGQYYWDILLSHQMLAAIKRVADDNCVFQQDSAPVHCVHNIDQLLQHETQTFCLVSYGCNSPEMKHIDYKIQAVIQQREYEL